nr:hypothetical protein [Sporolactobacillus inulinus]
MLVDGSPSALILPSTIVEFFQPSTTIH